MIKLDLDSVNVTVPLIYEILGNKSSIVSEYEIIYQSVAVFHRKRVQRRPELYVTESDSENTVDIREVTPFRNVNPRRLFHWIPKADVVDKQKFKTAVESLYPKDESGKSTVEVETDVLGQTDSFKVVCQSREPMDLMEELQKNADENCVKRKVEMVEIKKEDDSN
ncbi:uncharacterized protein B0J16DRAFT_319940 [Fusarium flagelliforme]|uniref:uncharacterized protein n=1 Tax=Fusarium flagelliforme TaxID=2675880 RepID=UPI001E8E1D1D|nr:uncharacterized protein B0J16DRAFT_319940 [Fusarium flagelliforme]KAH7185149.1 hypothetical protein B0J16DRAFT_319940 [Fusarium flagelliforme]